jgi:hypothetical protein
VHKVVERRNRGAVAVASVTPPGKAEAKEEEGRSYPHSSLLLPLAAEQTTVRPIADMPNSRVWTDSTRMRHSTPIRPSGTNNNNTDYVLHHAVPPSTPCHTIIIDWQLLISIPIKSICRWRAIFERVIQDNGFATAAGSTARQSTQWR